MRNMIKCCLKEQGYNICVEASNGEEATHIYKTLRPDIVTMDITMSVTAGLTAAKEIINADPNAKILMMTAMGQRPMIIEAVKFGIKNNPGNAEVIFYIAFKISSSIVIVRVHS